MNSKVVKTDAATSSAGRLPWLEETLQNMAEDNVHIDKLVHGTKEKVIMLERMAKRRHSDMAPIDEAHDATVQRPTMDEQETTFRLEPDPVFQQLDILMSLRATSLQAHNNSSSRQQQNDTDRQVLETTLAAAERANATLNEELAQADVRIAALKAIVASMVSERKRLRDAMVAREGQVAYLVAQLEEAKQREVQCKRRLTKSSLTASGPSQQAPNPAVRPRPIIPQIQGLQQSLSGSNRTHAHFLAETQNSQIVALQGQLARVTAMYRHQQASHAAEIQSLRNRLQRAGVEHPIEIIDVDAVDEDAGDSTSVSPYKH